MRSLKTPFNAILVLVASVTGASAHERHAHGDEPSPPDVQTAPRAAAASPLFELVFWTTVEVETPAGPVAAMADGEVYRLDAPWMGEPGDNELLFTVTDGSGIDFPTSKLKVPALQIASVTPPGTAGLLCAAFAKKVSEVVAANIGERLRSNDPALLAVGEGVRHEPPTTCLRHGGPCDTNGVCDTTALDPDAAALIQLLRRIGPSTAGEAAEAAR